MSNSITQDMKYRQSLMKYAEKYGVSRASRKYNKGRSYIYFWRSRWDGTVESLGCQSRRPHSQPRLHSCQQFADKRRHLHADLAPAKTVIAILVSHKEQVLLAGLHHFRAPKLQQERRA